MIQESDVVVVGGGISGLASAKFLAEGGLEVIVLEKNSAPGGSFGENVQGIFTREKTNVENLGINIKKYSPVKNLTIWTPKREPIEFAFTKPVLYLVLRGKGRNSLDSFLAEGAEKAGASIVYNARVHKLMENGKQIIGVETANKEFFKAKYFVAADGVLSTMRKLMNLPRLEKKGVGIWAKIEYPKVRRDSLQGIFDQRLAPMGYGYLNPYPDEKCMTAGISFKPKYATESYLSYFQNFLNFVTKYVVKEKREIKRFSGFVTCGDGNQQVLRKNVLFTGEAGGFQDPIFGFGIVSVINSAKIASEVIIENHKNHDIHSLKTYATRSHDTIIRKIKLKRQFRKLFMDNMKNADIEIFLKFAKREQNVTEKMIASGEWEGATWLACKGIMLYPQLLRLFIPKRLKDLLH